MEYLDTLTTVMAAWLLLAGVSYWSHKHELGLSKELLIASVRAPLQLFVLALILHWLFDIESHWAQAGVILVFCIIAGHTASGYHPRTRDAWIAATFGLACAVLATLPWLVIARALADDARTLIPLGSMVVANGMNAVSIMYERMKPEDNDAVIVSMKEGLRAAMISPTNTLKVVGLVHMPGIFVGMILAGSTVLAAASAQLVVLYMIVASSFTGCVMSFLIMRHLHKGIAD